MPTIEAVGGAAGIAADSWIGRGLAGAAMLSAGLGEAGGDSPRYTEWQIDADISTPFSIGRTIAMVLLSDAEAGDSFSSTRLIGLALISTSSLADSIDMSDRQLAMDIRAAAQAMSDGMVLDANDAAVWVVNPRTGAAWRYENFSFSRFVETKRFTYGVRQDGIYLLGGSDDDGDQIRASVDMGRQDFGTTKNKRLHTAYFTTDATGGMQLRVTDDSGNAYMYAITPSERMDTAKVKLGRGLVANYFDLQLFNTDGGDFDLAGVELLFDVLSRRV